jgi:hypothetical protein
MTCPAAGVCYIVDGDPVTDPADEANVGYPSHLLTSLDDETAWSEVDPVGVTNFTTALVRPLGNGDDCVAGGMLGTVPMLHVSTDGGVTWVDRELPPERVISSIFRLRPSPIASA